MLHCLFGWFLTLISGDLFLDFHRHFSLFFILCFQIAHRSNVSIGFLFRPVLSLCLLLLVTHLCRHFPPSFLLVCTRFSLDFPTVYLLLGFISICPTVLCSSSLRFHLNIHPFCTFFFVIIFTVYTRCFPLCFLVIFVFLLSLYQLLFRHCFQPDFSEVLSRYFLRGSLFSLVIFAVFCPYISQSILLSFTLASRHLSLFFVLIFVSFLLVILHCLFGWFFSHFCIDLFPDFHSLSSRFFILFLRIAPSSCLYVFLLFSDILSLCLLLIVTRLCRRFPHSVLLICTRFSPYFFTVFCRPLLDFHPLSFPFLILLHRISLCSYLLILLGFLPFCHSVFSYLSFVCIDIFHIAFSPFAVAFLLMFLLSFVVLYWVWFLRSFHSLWFPSISD